MNYLFPLSNQLTNFKNHFLFIAIIININYLFIGCQGEYLDLSLDYPIAFTLSNLNIMIYTTKGIYTFDSNLSSMIYSYNFTSQIYIDPQNTYNINYPSFSQFSNNENGNILVHIKGNVYLFDKNGKFLWSANIADDLLINDGITYRIISYKYTNKEIYYSIVYVYDSIIYTLLYKINEINGENQNIIKNSYQNDTRSIPNYCLTCQRMKKNINYYIACSYSYYKIQKSIIAVEIFDPNNNNLNFIYQKEIEINTIPGIYESVVNEDGSKIFICCSQTVNIFCFNYDINLNEFSEIITTSNSCKGDMFSILLYYFKNTREYIFSCKNTYKTLTIAKFDENMNLINNFVELELDDIQGINSFSIVYLPNKHNYRLLLYNPYSSIELVSFPDSIPTPTIIEETILTSKIIECHDNCKTCNEEPTDNSENCLTCLNDQKIVDNNKNCVCNILNGYYSVKYPDGTFDNECYTNKTKPINFYLNKNYFEICNQNCQTCEIGGNEKENNCITCANNYIQKPDSNYSLTYINCVPKCPFYYYITSYNYYICTENEQCPEEANLFIKNKNKCIDNCLKDDKYKYQYNSECFEKCPNGTIFNGILCKEDNSDKCSSSINEINIPYNNITIGNIELLTKNYLNEFYFLNNKIVLYANNEYSIFIYKNSSCGENLNMPKIDFGDCYQKVQYANNIKDNLLIVIIERYLEKENPITSYGFFDPKTGEKLDTTDILKNETIIINESILSFPGINSSMVKFFGEQGINVLDLNDKFFIDVCYDYNPPIKRDIPLKLRIKLFFPNISLCDDDCIWKSFNYETMESVCECIFNDLFHNKYLNHSLKFSEKINNAYELIKESNIDVLLCFKDIFRCENIIKCYGCFLILSLIIIQIVCSFFYCISGHKKISKYIYSISSQYLDKNPINKKLSKFSKKIEKEKEKKNKKNKNNDSNTTRIRNKKNILIMRSSSINNSVNKLKNIKLKTAKKGDKINLTIIPQINDNSSENIIKFKKKYNLISPNIPKINFDEYLLTDYDDMDFEDIIEKDKRKILKYIYDSIKEKNLIVNSFITNHNIKPKSIKILFFILTVDFDFLFNGLFFTESYITQLYYISTDESIFNFVPRTFDRLFFLSLITFIINELIDWFIVEEKKLKGILLRGKNKNSIEVKSEILKLVKKIMKNYYIFITLSYLITMFTLIYVACFIDVYYYTGLEWAKSGCFYFILMQIFSIISIFLESFLRFLAIQCESEKMFKLSKL